MLANDIKKGFEVVANGFSGVMADNKRGGNTRMVTVKGMCGTETGSVYVWDISSVKNPETQEWERVQLTDKQRSARMTVRAFFG